jgi:DNA-binding transcriptional ArsR family regulator
MTEPRNPGDNIPRREIRDAQILRGMAHPLRLKIMEELVKAGHATATELAERTGESAANCSWHLRQLAKYGFIEEAEGGTGRQRPWRPIAQSVDTPADREQEPEAAAAGDALHELLLQREVTSFRRWLVQRPDAPRKWRDATFSTQSWDYLTPDELTQFREEFMDLIRRFGGAHADRIDPAKRPPEAQPVRLVAWAYPADLFPGTPRTGMEPGMGIERGTGMERGADMERGTGIEPGTALGPDNDTAADEGG